MTVREQRQIIKDKNIMIDDLEKENQILRDSSVSIKKQLAEQL